MINTDELDAELTAGRNADLNLVRHLRIMNAAALEIPIEFGGKEYVVTVKEKEPQ